jgi:hypothetical protein
MSNLFSDICKHCKDPLVTHDHDGRYCFVMSCNCPGYERDNLIYLEWCHERTI